MLLRHRVALDGVQLDEIDDSIIIDRIETADGKENISTVSLAGAAGARVTTIHRDSMDISVKFRLRLRKTEMATRESVLEAINQWAFPGGWLTTNYKTDRRIRVFRAQAAGIGDPWDWTKEYTIVFRACGVPYWQEETANTLQRADVTDSTLTMGITGSAVTVLEADFLNTSGAEINTLTINTGESILVMESLGLANGETFTIDHHDNGRVCLLRMYITGAGGVTRSVYGKRTRASSDDLTVNPGVHNIHVTAGGSGRITLRCRGRFA